MKRIHIATIIIVISAVVLLFIAAILFFLGFNTKEDLDSKIVASIESILNDWELLEEDTHEITVTEEMSRIYTPESLKKLSLLLGGDEELQISIYYTNYFNSFNKSGKIIVTKDYIGIPFVDNEGYNIYYYFMISNGKVYDIAAGPWK